jgi:hypothetical protein
MTGFGFGFPPPPMTCCSRCGEWMEAGVLRDGLHVCDHDTLVEYQVMQARRDLARIETELAGYLATPRARNLLAFRRYLDERDVDRRAA